MDIINLIPIQKDFERVRDFEFNGTTFYGSGAPFSSKARKMAKSIKDKEKLIKRAKAVISIWGTKTYYGYSRGKQNVPIEHNENVWIPFEEALRNFGLTNLEIDAIKNYKHLALV